MKRILSIALVLVFAVSGIGYAQLTKEQIKERKEHNKALRKEVNEKAMKAARKEAKKLEKEGWKTPPGKLPIDKQLDKSYLLQADGEYIFGNASSIGGNYDAAKFQALELAKLNLVNNIQSELVGITSNSIANSQLDQEDAASITRTISESKSRIEQKLGRIIPVMEIYREINGKNREVSITIAYSLDEAKAVAKQAVKEELEQRGDELRDQLDQLLGW